MSFVESIRVCFHQYSEFTGAAGRPEFWWWALFNALVGSALGTLNVIAIGEDSSLGAILASIWAIGTLLPTLAVGARRLTDAGDDPKNLWWLLIPIAGVIVLITYWAKPTGTGAEQAQATPAD